jgi:hypothetical protein
MKSFILSRYGLIFAGLAALLFTPHDARGCACGCGIYDVGTSYNFPDGAGWMAWTEYNFQSQSYNWSGLKSAPASNNDDKLIRTSWLSAGIQYFPTRSWGFDVTVPSANRLFKTAKEDGPPGSTTVHQWWSLGDLRANVYYTGFSPDMSTGVNLGLKLPTGNWTEPGVDRDNQIGTGSTDILFGFYHRHRITLDEKWTWFAQTQFDIPLFTQAGYRPGMELNAAAGVYYSGLQIGKVKIRPLAQVLFSFRASDSGPAASPANTGYERVLLSPGVEFDCRPFRVYADVELPVITNVVGNQLISVSQLKVVASVMF